MNKLDQAVNNRSNSREEEQDRSKAMTTPTLPDTQLNDAIDALFYALDSAGITFLRFASVDLSNAIRIKSVPMTRLLKSHSSSDDSSSVHKLNYSVAIAEIAMGGLPNYADHIPPGSPLDARKVLSLHPDLSTLRILPYSAKSAMVLCTLWDHQTISPFCTRNLLSQVLYTAKKEYNLGFNVGVELEFCLFHRPENIRDFSSSALQPIDHSLFSYPTILNQQDEYISELCDALTKQRIQVELVHAESTFGQLEIVLRYENDALKMADHIVYARETIIELAKKKNMCALFLPKILPDQAGNGMHYHLSMYDATSGKNIFSGSSPASISDIGSSFMEGILTHMPALMALTNPTRNSFRRVGLGNWTGFSCQWDVEHKDVPMRVCLDLETGMATNVEYKLSDSTANVYLQIAGLLTAGLDGIQRNLQLRSSLSSSSSGSKISEDLPVDLSDSLQLLLNNGCLSKMMGEPMLKSYLVTKMDEMKECNDLSQEVMRAFLRSS